MTNTERNDKRRLRQRPVVFKTTEPILVRSERRRLARAAGLEWGRDYQIFDEPNPNGNRHHRRHVVSVWRRYLNATV
jgi:energy-coupling factor transporter ATP-binding protein EcfA2